MAKHHTNQRQRGNAALQLAALSALPMQTSLQVSRKLDCTNPPIKDAQSLPGRAQGTSSAPGANAAAPADATPPANAALLQAGKNTCLTPTGGVESRSIAPSPGVVERLSTPGDGAIRGCFCHLSTPGDGDHLEKPSVREIKPRTSEKFNASPHADCSTTLKGKQPNPFTGGAALCYIAIKPKGPVLDTPKHSGCHLHRQARFCHAQIYGTGAPCRIVSSWLWGWERIPVRIAARLCSCVYPHLHPHCLDSMKVVPLIHTGIQTMTVATSTSRRAAPSPSTTGTADPIQLHADAHNALNMAVFYLRQPDANVAGARRKAIQALTALRGLSLALEG